MKSKFISEFLNPALLYGGILGIFTLIHSAIISMLDLNFSTYNQIINYIIPVVGLIYCLKAYRKEYLGGIMSYNHALRMAYAIMIITGIITAIYTFIYISYINPDYFREAELVMEEKLLNKGMYPDMIEKAMEISARMRTVKWAVLGSLLFYLVYGGIVSLIVSAFMKKETADPFKDVK